MKKVFAFPLQKIGEYNFHTSVSDDDNIMIIAFGLNKFLVRFFSDNVKADTWVKSLLN